jgi:formylglycine-generating enzyme required for sulfatase activity
MVGVMQPLLPSDLTKAGRRDSAARTAACGNFEENRFGLYDIGGNAGELCSTWYTADLNDAETMAAFPSLKDDPEDLPARVVRGASWRDDNRVALRSSFRWAVPTRFRSDYIGFRCVLVVSGG